MSRHQNLIGFDESKKVFYGRFYEFKDPNKVQPPRKNLCTLDELRAILQGAGLEWNKTNRTAELKRLYDEQARALKLKQTPAQHYKDPSYKPSPPIRDIMQLWLDSLSSANRSIKTIEHYLYVVNLYIVACTNHPIKEYSQFHQTLFNNHVKSLGVSPATHGTYIRVLQGFFNWALDNNYLDRSYKFKAPKQDKKEPGIYSEKHLHDLEYLIDKNIKEAKQPWRKVIFINHKRAFKMFISTAMRAGEVWALMLKSIDLKNELIHIRKNPILGWEPKKKKQSEIVIPAILIPFLEEDLKNRGENEIFFLDNGFGKPIWSSVSNVSQAFDRYKKKLGVNAKVLHGLRATRLSGLLKEGVDSAIVQQLARHDKITTTMKYIRTDQLPVKQAIDDADSRHAKKAKKRQKQLK